MRRGEGQTTQVKSQAQQSQQWWMNTSYVPGQVPGAGCTCNQTREALPSRSTYSDGEPDTE